LGFPHFIGQTIRLWQIGPMTLSTEELAAGQKAYQRMKQFESSKPTRVTWAILFWFLAAMIFGGFHNGHYGPGIFWTVLLAAIFWQSQRQKERCQKDFEFVRQLKLKYGPEIYSEIKEEPSSLYYYIFQKRYPPDNQRGSVALP
jgi:hypothetical protein